MVTEYVCTGRSILQLKQGLESFGLHADIAAISSDVNLVGLVDSDTKIFFGETEKDSGTRFFQYRGLTGLISTPGSVFATRLNMDREKRSKALRARADAKIVADYLWQFVK